VQRQVSLCVPWLIYLCHMAHSLLWHAPFTRVKWALVGQRAVPALYARIQCVTWLFHTGQMCDMALVTHTMCDLILILCVYTCDMTHAHSWCDAFLCVKWLMHTSLCVCVCVCVCVGLYVWHDSQVPLRSMTMGTRCTYSCTCVTWLVVTCLYMWHDSFVCVTWRIPIWEVTLHTCVTWLIGASEVHNYGYGVTTVSRIDEVRCILQNMFLFIVLFCKRDL